VVDCLHTLSIGFLRSLFEICCSLFLHVFPFFICWLLFWEFISFVSVCDNSHLYHCGNSTADLSVYVHSFALASGLVYKRGSMSYTDHVAEDEQYNRCPWYDRGVTWSLIDNSHFTEPVISWESTACLRLAALLVHLWYNHCIHTRTLSRQPNNLCLSDNTCKHFVTAHA